ncbi:MAG: SDR family NAD(P)-dependent oxidoreductase, partial [Burkholderia gladioli]
LPGYPFADERYWLKPLSAEIVAAAPAPVETGEAAALFFEESWQSYSIRDASLAGSARTLLCCLSDAAHRRALREAVARHDPQWQLVFLDRQAPEPLDRQGWTDALRVLEQGGAAIDAVLYLRALEDAGLRRAEAAPLGLVQAIGSMKTRPARLVLGGEYADERERGQLEAWIGLERSMGLALPGCRAVTVLREAVGDTIDWAAWTQLLGTALDEAAPRNLLADRDGLRHLQVQPLALTRSEAAVADLGRTVLITGGAGGLGLIFARHLAAGRRCNLVLVGRSPLDAARQAAVQALQAAGSEVLYLSADVADAAAMREVVAQARARFGAIDSVIHAAGVQHAVPLADKQPEDVRRVLDPKVCGALVLDQVLAGEPLRLVCYFSSSSSVLGDFGSADYALANRFLAAHALAREQRRARGECAGRSLAIEWPLWREGGMGVGDDAGTALYLKSSGQQLLEQAEGLAAFERLLASGATRALVLVGERERLHRMLGLAAAPVAAPAASATQAMAAVTPPQTQTFSTASLEEQLSAELSALIGGQVKLAPELLDAESNLADFGLDSFGLAELARALSALYGIEVAPSLFFAYSSIARLAGYLLDRHRAEVEAHRRAATRVDAAAAIAQQPASAAPPAAVSTPEQAQALAQALVASAIEPAQPTAPAFDGEREPIAIIGISGRFPKARDVEQMWRILAEGIDALGEIPAERFDWRDYYGGREAQPGKTNSKWAGCLDGVDEFDPLFFEISPREALAMDPRQRLLLQESWNALEDAGYGPRQLRAGPVGIFVGVEEGDYQRVAPELGVTSNHNGILASRLAYFLDLNGPVLAINTACSSGLVALHQACASLLSGESDTAIAAGANLILTPEPYVGMSQAGMLSPDGRCRAFDCAANGMVPGEAVAVVVLKRWSRAVADGDPIRGLIRASGINNDGRSNGITAPNALAQASLVRQVQRAAGVAPEQIDYVVTHGTGTRLGDPVEIQALAEAFGQPADGRAYCALTSNKGNFGHTFAASGLLSLIGLVQALEHDTIPPSLHCDQDSDYIAWRDSAFHVNKQARPWPRVAGRARLGAVSAFGMSGTNAHVLVQEAPAVTARVAGAPADVVLALSAKTEVALRERLLGLRDWLASPAAERCELASVSRTLLDGRHHFAHRAAVVVANRASAIAALEHLAALDAADGPDDYLGKAPRGFKGEAALRERAANWPAQPLPDSAAYRARLGELARLHCQGYAVTWSALDGLQAAARVHLPGYPFARESYWPKTRIAPPAAAPLPASSVSPASPSTPPLPAAISVRPMLRTELSDPAQGHAQARYVARFSGEEFFLRDHRVRGQAVLPGVAYLELAREALEARTGHAVPGGLQLQHVTWVQPMMVDAPGVEARIDLHRQDNGEWRYEVASGSHAEGERRLHGQGFLALVAPAEPAALDLPALHANCRSAELDSAACYAAYQAVGIEYGPSFRAVQRVWVGEGQALAQLRQPAETLADSEAYALHPSLLDGALQAS